MMESETVYVLGRWPLLYYLGAVRPREKELRVAGEAATQLDQKR